MHFLYSLDFEVIPLVIDTPVIGVYSKFTAFWSILTVRIYYKYVGIHEEIKIVFFFFFNV